MKPKVLIIILVVLVVLFVIGLGAGVTRGPTSSADLTAVLNAPWAQSISAALKQELPVADIDLVIPPACHQPSESKVFQIEVGRTCIVTVKGSGAPVRTLALQLTQGTATQVQVSQKDRMDITVTLDAGQPRRSFDIYRDGGTLTLYCLPGGVAQCQVTLG